MPLFDLRPLSAQPEGSLPGAASSVQLDNDLLNAVQPLQNIAFVDAGLDHVETLIQGLENTQVVVINSDQDGIAQITSVLATQQNLDSVQIFSHGMDGSLQLGDAVLSSGTISGYSSQLEQWRAALSEQADVMLYGCNLATGDSGLALLSRISDLTGADVAASDDLTGQGGDWDLEVAVGSIEAAVALTQTAQATYEGTLALLNNGDFEQNLDGWSPFTGTETVSTTESFSGSASLQLSAAGSGVNQTMDVLVGESYTFTGNAKSSSSGYTAVGINFFDENYNYLDGTSQTITVGDWGAFQLESTAVAGSRYVQFWAYKDTAAGDFFVDNLVADTDGVAPPPPPPPSGGTELLINSGFESGLSSWSGFTGSEVVSTAESFAGGSSLQLSDATSGTAQLINTVVAGEEYTLSAYAKSSSNDYVGLGINFFDANFNVLAGGVGQRITSTDWQQYQATTTAPTGASYVQVWTYKSDGTGDAFLDEISLTFGGTTPPPPTDTAAPTTSLSASDVSSVGSSYDFTVTYADESAVDVSTLDGSDIQVTGPNGFSQSASLVSVNQNGDGTPRTATYQITPPGGDWAAADNGTYAIALVAGEVADTVGNTVSAANLGNFTVTVQDAPPPPTDTTAPTVSFTDAYVTTSGATSYAFDIEFEDDTAVDVSTLTNNDIRVVGPNGFSQLAQFVGVNNNTNGPSRIATYRITPPGGSWDSADNGIYTVELRANQVSDTSGNFASAATLGNIDVTLEGRIDLGNLNAGIAARDGATGTGYLLYSEELLPVRFIDNPPYSSSTYGENANNLIGVVFQNGQWYYDDNSNLRSFTPRSTDLLLAELNFGADTATLLQGQNRLINGIRAGYEAGDLTVTPNVWNGSTGGIAAGEFGVTGTYVTISDDGLFEGQLSLASSTVEIDEDAGALSVTVNRTDGSDGQVTVNYATSGVSATSGQDFTSTSGTLVFEEGQISRTIQVPIINDTDSEADETFFINLSNPTGGATLGTSGTAVTILNDDAPPTPGNPGDLLPDLTPIASTLTEDLRIDTTTLSGRTILRLSTEVANTGAGPLEIWGGSASGDSQPVFQRIYNDTGGSRDELAGEFVYHPSHGHIHFEGFATYSLRQVTAGNGVGSIMASGGKTSFCLINIRQPFPELTNAAQVWDGRGGNSCGQIQGIDVGYSDVYGAGLPDQWIDVTNLSDGTYWLEAIADPDDNMLELDETNNVARVQITLNNGQVFA